MAAKDWLLHLMPRFYRASFLTLTKSRSNLWLSSWMQIFFYIAQFLFWTGLQGHQNLLTGIDLYGFFVTMALIDNAYLAFFGPGSLLAQELILSRKLEQLILYPRSALMLLMFMRPNLHFLPCFVLSVAAFIVYVVMADVSFLTIGVFLLAALFGILTLNLISFLYRFTSFWTASIVQIRNANPSFKIMVRPLDAFYGPLRMILLTLFPALFITGVPAKMLAGEYSAYWLLWGSVAVCWLWLLVCLMWKRGLRRYGIRSA